MEKKNKKKGKTRVSKVEKKRWKHDQWEIQFTFIYRIKQTVPAFGWLWTFRVKSRFHSTSSMANNAPIWCSTEHFQPQTCYIWYHMISTHTIGTSKCTISYYLFRGAIETHRVATTAPFGCLPTVKSSEALMRLEKATDTTLARSRSNSLVHSSKTKGTSGWVSRCCSAKAKFALYLRQGHWHLMTVNISL